MNRTEALSRQAAVVDTPGMRGTLPDFDVRRLPPEDFWYLVTVMAFFTQGVWNTIGEAIATVAPDFPPTTVTILAAYLPFVLFLTSRIRTRGSLGVLPFLTVYVSLLICMMVTLIVHPENANSMFDAEWTGNIYPILFDPVAPVVAILIVTIVPQPALLLHGLRYAAYLTYAGNIVRLGQATVTGSWSTRGAAGQEIELSYNLGFGYSVLFTIVVLLYFAYSGHRPLLHGLAIVAGLGMILTNGSRAPFGIALAAIAIFSIYFGRRLFFSSPARVILLVLFLAALTAIVTNLERLLLGVQSTMESMGMESRTLDRLALGTLSEDTARDELGEMSEQMIAEGGPWGHGLYGDREHIRSIFRWGYPHNIVDELVIQFGYVGGPLLIAAAVIFVIAAFIKSRGTIYNSLIVLFVPLTFQLWVSLSYLMSIWLWALFGACWLALTRSDDASGDPTANPRERDAVTSRRASRIWA